MRLGFIDALRGLAVIGVLIQHLAIHYYRDPSISLLQHDVIKMIFVDFIDLGRFGVVLFFMISGFVIPYSFSGTSPVARFAVSRFFRLYPAFWFGLAVAILVDYVFLGVNYPFKTVLANITMLPKVFGGKEISGVYWTLFIEMMFYGMCAGLFVLNVLKNWVVVAGLVFLFALMGPWVMLINALLHTHLPAQFLSFHLSFLFLGFLLRMAFYDEASSDDKKHLQYVAMALVVFQIISAAIATGVFFAVKPGVFSPYDGIGVVISYLLAMALFFLTIKNRTSLGGFWQKMGDISYSMYL
nr:acyltransferase [uncultured Tolumonas sp.]